MLVTARLEALYSRSSTQPDGAVNAAANPHSRWLDLWLGSWGPGFWWSEYTLYAIALHQHGIFYRLHHHEVGHDDALSCNSVWFAGDLPWNASTAFQNSRACPFAVIQSSSGADVAGLAHDISKSLLNADVGYVGDIFQKSHYRERAEVGTETEGKGATIKRPN